MCVCVCVCVCVSRGVLEHHVGCCYYGATWGVRTPFWMLLL